MNHLAALLLSIIPIEITIEDSVDVVERNQLFDLDGNHVFEQLIFREWCDETGRFEVVAWRLVKQPLTHPKGCLLLLDDGKLRRVRYRSMCESWTQYDPEIVERQWWPKEQRRGLRGD